MLLRLACRRADHPIGRNAHGVFIVTESERRLLDERRLETS
jgi:hypothetical protein